MKKILILWAMYCLTASVAMAQCPASSCQFAANHWRNKVRICGYTDNSVGIKFKLSESAIVGTQVIFELQGNATATGLAIDFGDGNGAVTVPSGTITVNYPSIGTKTLLFPDGITLGFISKTLLIKPFITTSNKTYTYKSPDAVWSIETSTTFDPVTADAKASYFSSAVNAQGVMNNTKGEGQAYIQFGKKHNGKIVRPIIYVDGIDFNSGTDIIHDSALGGTETSKSNIIRYGGTGWDVFVLGVEPSITAPGETEAFQKYPEHFEKMYNEGYDVIFLDFKEGATYMQKNAEVLIELINQINGVSTQNHPERKKVTSNGILYENVVVGASMGGQVAKYALAKMEYAEHTANGPSHCSKMYVSFDSQHKGAIIPIGIQGAAWFANQTCTNTSLWSSLNQPAARQLLIEHLSNAVAKEEVSIRFIPTSDFPGAVSTNELGVVTLEADKGKLRDKFLQDLQTFSPNGMGYPTTTNNIAIANGNSTGKIPMTFGKFAPLINTHLIVPTVFAGSFRPLHFRVNASDGISSGSSFCETDFGCSGQNLRVLNVTSAYFGGMIPNGSLCLGKLPNKYQVGFVLKHPDFTTVKPSYDNAPGSYRRDLNTLHEILVDSAKEQGGNAVDLTNNWTQQTCFSPTLSCLDVIGKSATNETDLNMNIDAAYKSGTAKTPFDSYYAPHAEKTLQHVEIDDEIMNYVNQQLALYNEEPLIIAAKSLTKIYNFGLFKKRIPTMNIGKDGELFVNRNAKTAFLNETEAANNKYTCYITGCGGAIVSVNPDGKFVLGNDATAKDMSGIVYVNPKSILRLNGGNMTLLRASVLIVDAYGKAELNNGKVDLRGTSTVQVANKGVLSIKGTTSINMYDNSQIIVEQGGRLIIENDIVFNMLSQSARIVIKNGGTLEVNGAIKVNGDGFIEFEQGNIVDVKVPALKLTGSGKNKRFIQIDNNATLKTENVSLYINLGAITYAKNASIVVKNAPYVHINYVTANGGNDNGVAFNLLQCNGNIDVNNSDFNDLDRGFLIQNKQTGTFGSDYNTFSYCTLGISSVGGGGNYILSQNTTFLHNGIGCELRNQSGIIELWSTIFRYNNFGLYLSQNSQTVRVVSCTFGENHRVGILTEGIPSLVVSSGTLYKHNNDAFAQAENFTVEIPPYNPPTASCFGEEPCFAIYNADNSNIILTDGSLFKDNNYGVYKAEPVSFGGNADALVIDCTTFDNNIYAVKGKDIEVMADAQLNQQTPNKPVRSNNFIQGKEGQFFFDICYGKLNNTPSRIYLRENYWETIANGAGNSPDPTLISFKEFCANDCEHCNILKNCINYDDSEWLLAINSKCFPVGKPPKDDTSREEYLKASPASRCDTPTKGGFAGEDTPVHGQYRYAYFGLFDPKSNIDEVMSSFARVAETPLEKEDASVCAQYIRVARAFTDMYPDEKGTFSSKVQKIKTLTNLYPNPADNILNIHVEKGAYSLHIMDVQGKVVYTEEAEGDIVINTSAWQSGVYQVLITDKATGLKTTEKVIIMK